MTVGLRPSQQGGDRFSWGRICHHPATVADVRPADQSTIFRGVRVMGGQGQQVPRTITLKELGLTGEAWMPLSISVVVFLVAALSGLLVTMPAWHILGVGRPFLPGFLMPVTAFFILLI